MVLSKKYRLKSSKEIENVFKQGKSTRSGFLFLKYLSNGMDHPRAAFSIGLGFSKKATERNKAKRILRNEFKKQLENIKGGHDIVIYFAKVTPQQLSTQSMRDNMANALEKSNLINN